MYLAERGEYLLAARRGGAVWLTRGSITACRWCQLTGWLSRLTESGPAAQPWGHRDLASDVHQTGTTAIAESDRIHLLLRSQLPAESALPVDGEVAVGWRAQNSQVCAALGLAWPWLVCGAGLAGSRRWMISSGV
jgi:hypothetical protein